MEGNTFRNTTEYNKEAVHVFCQTVGKSSRRGLLAVGIFAVAYSVISILFLTNTFIPYILLGVGISELAVVLSLMIRAKRSEKVILDNIRLMKGADTFTATVIIDKEYIKKLQDNGEDRVLQNIDISKAYETEHYFFVIYKGNAYAIFDKQGFENGTSGDFRTILKNYNKLK